MSITFDIRGRINVPMNAMANIRTGKRAKLRLPKSVECIRHSSLNMCANSVSIFSAPLHKLHEEIVEMDAFFLQFVRFSGVEEPALVQYCKFSADLFCDLEDVR